MIGTRVIVIVILPNGQAVYGTVLVNSDEECPFEYIVSQATAWVNEGGWGTGGRGTGLAIVEIAYPEQTVEGGFDNPALTLECGGT